jgi:GTP cyclohydrolase I
MTMRGIKKPGSQTVTIARRGIFAENPMLEERFFRMLGRN